MKTISVSCVAMSLVLIAWAQAPSLPAYKIDTSRSKVEISVFKGGILKALGHDHMIEAKSFSGTVQFDAGKVKDSSVTLSIDSASLTVLDPLVSGKDRSEIQATMEGHRVIDVTTFPRITFHSTRVIDVATSRDALDVTLTGKLKLHGVEKEITFPVRVRVQKNVLQATGTVTIAQTDFGIIPIKAGGGTVRVKNQLKISFDILAEKMSG